MEQSLELVIPVYNEAGTIEEVLGEIEGKLRMPHLVTIVYDSESDTTLPVLRVWQKSHANLRLLKNCHGRGALNAIKSGMENASTGVVLVMMADLADDLSNVGLMFAKINEGYDIVCGSRYMKGGRQVGGPLLKRWLSRLAGLSLYYLAGMPTRDVTNSFKMYRREVLKALPIESSGGFELGMEIVVKAQAAGFRITEVPAVWRDRQSGKSRFRLWRWLPGYLRWYWYGLRHGLFVSRSVSTR